MLRTFATLGIVGFAGLLGWRAFSGKSFVEGAADLGDTLGEGAVVLGGSGLKSAGRALFGEGKKIGEWSLPFLQRKDDEPSIDYSKADPRLQARADAVGFTAVQQQTLERTSTRLGGKRGEMQARQSRYDAEYESGTLFSKMQSRPNAYRGWWAGHPENYEGMYQAYPDAVNQYYDHQALWHRYANVDVVPARGPTPTGTMGGSDLDYIRNKNIHATSVVPQLYQDNIQQVA